MKIRPKKFKPAWEVVLITAKIAYIFTGVNFIKSIFLELFFSFLLNTLLTQASAGFNRVTSAIWPV